jgi:surface protein
MKRLLLLLPLILFTLVSCSKEEEQKEPGVIKFNLTVTSSPPEGGYVDPKNGIYEIGQMVNIIAMPNSGFAFKKWSGDESGNIQSLSIRMLGDKNLVANFEKEPYVILDSNGVTLKSSPDTPIGTQLFYNGNTYTVVGEPQLSKMISNNEDVSKIITSQITHMTKLFQGNISFNQDISSWDTSNVVNMSYMFQGATSFNQDISNWDTSKVTNMRYMFAHNLFEGISEFNQDISGWITSNVTSMQGMFMDSDSFNQDIGNWDTSNVTNMSFMFYKAVSFNQDLSEWCVSKVSVYSRENFRNFTTGWTLPKPVWGTCP